LVFSSLTSAQVSGPLTGVHPGNLVETPRGLRPLDLEGFSEDLDEDGYVDPLVRVQAAAVSAAVVPEIPVANVHAALPAINPVPSVWPHPIAPAYPYISQYAVTHPLSDQRYVSQMALHSPYIGVPHVPQLGHGLGGISK